MDGFSLFFSTLILTFIGCFIANFLIHNIYRPVEPDKKTPLCSKCARSEDCTPQEAKQVEVDNKSSSSSCPCSTDSEVDGKDSKPLECHFIQDIQDTETEVEVEDRGAEVIVEHETSKHGLEEVEVLRVRHKGTRRDGGQWYNVEVTASIPNHPLAKRIASPSSFYLPARV